MCLCHGRRHAHYDDYDLGTSSRNGNINVFIVRFPLGSKKFAALPPCGPRQPLEVPPHEHTCLSPVHGQENSAILLPRVPFATYTFIYLGKNVIWQWVSVVLLQLGLRVLESFKVRILCDTGTFLWEFGATLRTQYTPLNSNDLQWNTAIASCFRYRSYSICIYESRLCHRAHYPAFQLTRHRNVVSVPAPLICVGCTHEFLRKKRRRPFSCPVLCHSAVAGHGRLIAHNNM